MNGVLIFLTLEMLGNQLNELDRFPPHLIACNNCHFAQLTVDHLEKELGFKSDDGIPAWAAYGSMLPIHSRERAHLLETLRQARHCRDCWKALTFARTGPSRLENLANLKFFLGDADFAAGQMPPAAPWWRARKVD